jgi:DNA-binding transcriptional LysR family regulator
MVTIGREKIRPYAKTTRNRAPLFQLPGGSNTPLPLLSYEPKSYVRRIVDHLVERSPCFLVERHQTDMTGVLKAMVLEGHGIAFLPERAVARELTTGDLAPAGDERWSVELEIRLYRDRRNKRPEIDRLWEHAVTDSGGVTAQTVCALRPDRG